MLLGIPYHAALIYGGGDWFVSAPGGDYAFDVISGLTRSFRMPAFFIIAGFFAGLLLSRRTPRDWFAGRLLKLGLPLVTCVALLSPLQMLISAAAMHATSGTSVGAGFWSQVTEPGTHWVRHLWFLVALLWMSGGLAALHDRHPAAARWRLHEKAERLASNNMQAATGLLALIFAIYSLVVMQTMRQIGAASDPLAQMLGIRAVALHAPYFLFGALLSRSPDLLDRFTRPIWTLWGVGLVAMVAFALLWRQEATAMKIAAQVFASVSGLMMSHVLLSAARRWFDRPSMGVSKLVNASFVIYLAHQPLIAALGLAFLVVRLPPFVEFTAICFISLGACFALAKAVQAVPILNLLFNGTPSSASSPPDLRREQQV